MKAAVAADKNYKKAASKAVRLTISKAANKFAIKSAERSVKAGNTTAGATVSNKGTGTKTYKIASLSKTNYAGYFKINSKNGKITVDKKTPKGKYTVTVKAKAAQTTNYKASGWKTAKVTITVK